MKPFLIGVPIGILGAILWAPILMLAVLTWALLNPKHFQALTRQLSDEFSASIRAASNAATTHFSTVDRTSDVAGGASRGTDSSSADAPQHHPDPSN